MRFFLLLSLLLSIICSNIPCIADDQTPASVRTANREQALATLDSPDPIARLTAMEDILAGKDSLLKTLAARKVFSGTDADLQTFALRYFFSQSGRQYNFVIDDCRDLRHGSCNNYANKLKGVVTLVFSSMNNDSGEFRVYSLYSGQENDKYNIKSGRLTHGEAIFEADMDGGINLSCNDLTFHMKTIKGSHYIGTATCGDLFQLTGGFDLY